MSDSQLVADYWEHWRLARGDRAERLRAQGANVAHDYVSDAVEDGAPAVVDLIVALAEGAPSDGDVGLIGAGPLEELLSLHSTRLATVGGAALLDAIDAGARRSEPFRRVLRSALMGAELPAAVKGRLQRFL